MKHATGIKETVLKKLRNSCAINNCLNNQEYVTTMKKLYIYELNTKNLTYSADLSSVRKTGLQVSENWQKRPKTGKLPTRCFAGH